MKVQSLFALFAIATMTSAFAAGQVGSYVTEKGKTYHKQDCRIIKGKKVHVVTAEEAKKHKLKACKICKP